MSSVDANAIVPIQASGDRAPLYFVHAHGGSVVGYVDLALRLGEAQPFYGIQALPRTHDAGSIEDMGAAYARHIDGHQPAGPILLGGWCLGGVIAFEIARQLTGAGRDVSLVVMVQATLADYPHFKAGLGWMRPALTAVHRLKQEWGALREVERDQQRPHLLERARRARHAFVRAGSRRDAGGATNIGAGHTASFERYRPGTYAGRVAIVRAERQPRGARVDPTLGWGPYLTGEVVTRSVPGHQLRLLDEPRVQLVAQTMSELLLMSPGGS